MRMNMTFLYAFILCILCNTVIRVCGCILTRSIFMTNLMTFLGWPGFIIGPSHGGEGRFVDFIRPFTEDVILTRSIESVPRHRNISCWLIGVG
jgi:hypothetical protein